MVTGGASATCLPASVRLLPGLAGAALQRREGGLYAGYAVIQAVAGDGVIAWREAAALLCEARGISRRQAYADLRRGEGRYWERHLARRGRHRGREVLRLGGVGPLLARLGVTRSGHVQVVPVDRLRHATGTLYAAASFPTASPEGPRWPSPTRATIETNTGLSKRHQRRLDAAGFSTLCRANFGVADPGLTWDIPDGSSPASVGVFRTRDGRLAKRLANTRTAPPRHAAGSPSAARNAARRARAYRSRVQGTDTATTSESGYLVPSGRRSVRRQPTEAAARALFARLGAEQGIIEWGRGRSRRIALVGRPMDSPARRNQLAQEGASPFQRWQSAFAL